jgi:hypothetical protein
MGFLLLATTGMFAEPITGGSYKGKFEGAAGASGDFNVTLSKPADGAWQGAVVFTLNGAEVKCKVTSVQVNDAKMKMVYSFDLQGTSLESTIEGELKGSTLAGKYHTQVTGDGSAVDEGTFTTTSVN